LRLVVFVILFLAGTANAQKPAPEVRITGGWAGFIDEDWIDHGVVGGAFRYYLTRRISLEPEILYMIGPGTDRDITAIPHISYDFRPGKPLRPYIIGGAGLLRHSQKFGNTTFTSSEWTANFGTGVRIPLTPRLFVAPEFRIGFEPTMRITGVFGFTF
jgi:hypothetical protein